MDIDFEKFKELYPTTLNKDLMQIFDVSISSINRIKKRLGLEKSEFFLSEISRNRAIGKPKTEQTREKIRQKAIGRKMDEETKRKIIQTKIERGTLYKGENHYKWKGGKPWERFKNPEYIKWRNSVLERDGYVCQHCHRQCKKYEKGLAAHHIKEYAKFPELRFDTNNGLTLCRKCHMDLHGKSFEVEQIPCACGCRTIIDSKDAYGRERKYVNHHSSKGKIVGENTKELLRQKMKGRKLTQDHKNKISEGLKNSQFKIGRPKCME